jgi:phage terminase large subunit
MNDSPHILNQTQYNVLCDKHRYILYSGGYGSGKTVGGAYFAIQKSSLIDNNIGAIYGPTLKQLDDNVITTNLIPIMDSLFGRGSYEYKKGTMSYKMILPNWSEIRFRSFDDEGKIRGGDYNWIWIDEAIGKDQLYLNEARFSQLRARLRRGKDQQLLVTTNPGAISHFLYKYFVDDLNENPKLRDERIIHYGTIWDNKHLGQEYIRDMEGTYSMDELKGLWIKNIGVIYHEFNQKKHVKPIDIRDDFHYYLAIDFGYTNPFACLLIALDHDDNCYVIDEYYKTQTTIDLHAKYIQANFLDKYKVLTIVADPEDASNIAMLRKILKKDIVKASKRKERGIEAVTKLLKAETPKGPRLCVDPKCSNMIKEFETYAWLEPREGINPKEVPKDYMNHTMDAFRYFVMTILENKYNTVPISFQRY